MCFVESVGHNIIAASLVSESTKGSTGNCRLRQWVVL